MKWLSNLIPPQFRLIAAFVALILLIFVVMVMGDRIGSFFRDPFGWVAAGQAQDRSDARVAPHTKAADDAAAKAADDFHQRQAGREALGQENRDAILSTPNARADAGDAGRAGLLGLCRRPEYRDSPRCVQLLGPRSAQPSR